MEEKQLLKSMGKLEWKLRKKLRAMKKKGQAGTDEYNTLRWVTRCIGGILGNYERNYGKSTGREQGSQEQAGREQGSDGDAPCSRECPNIRPSDVLRSIWFYNEKWAAANLPYDTMCMSCHALCEKKCIKAGEVPIRDLITRLFLEVRPALEITVPDDMNRLSANLKEAVAYFK